jgi:hypothetical protein
MAEASSQDSNEPRGSLAHSVPAVILDRSDSAMANLAADGTRVFCLPASERDFSTLTARSMAEGWHIQGIRRIGDRLFVEHIAFSPTA